MIPFLAMSRHESMRQLTRMPGDVQILKDLPASERWPLAVITAMVWLVATYAWYLVYVRAYGGSPDNEITMGLGAMLVYAAPLVLGLLGALVVRWRKLTPLARVIGVVPIAA